jgi:hypothetical protein
MITTVIKVSANEFSAMIDSVRDAVGSLKGCLKNERENEAEILRRAVFALSAAKLLRNNERLLERRGYMLQYADMVLSQNGF